MNIEDVKSLITATLQRPELSLQVNQTSQQLSIVINRPNDLEVNYDDFARKILEAFLDKLSPEDLTSIDTIKFFGRIKGQPKQEWQKLQKLNVLAQKKVEPSPQFDSQSPPSITLPTKSSESQPPIAIDSQYESVIDNSTYQPIQTPILIPSNSSTSGWESINDFKYESVIDNSTYQPIQTPNNSSSSAWDLINNFKFGELLSAFKDIINTGALVGIFLILLINFFAGQKPRSVAWEYKIEAVSDLIFIESMDGYGKNGWELVSARRAVTDGVASYECIFKRVKQ